MALRRITDRLWTGGPEALKPDLLGVRYSPSTILRLDASVPMPLREPSSVLVDSPTRTSPDAALIRRWMAAGMPVLRSGQVLLVYSHDGNHRACTVASVFLAALDGRPWGEVLDELHTLFLSQGGHNWWPFHHWKLAITTHWRDAVLPYYPQPEKSSTPPTKSSRRL